MAGGNLTLVSKSTKKSRKKPRFKAYLYATKKQKNLNQKVNSIIDKRNEPKYIQPQVINNTGVFNILNGATTQLVPLMPNIAQGAGQSGRIGNEIRVKNASVNYNLNMFQVTTAGNNDPPKYIDIYIFKYKRSNLQSNVDLTQFLQYGGSAIPYDSGTYQESGMLYLNDDLFSLKKHIRHTLWNPNNNNTYALASKNIKNATRRKVDITKYIKKTLQYNDGTSNVVTNDNLYICCVYTNNDNSVYSGATSVGNFDTTLHLSYYDN